MGHFNLFVDEITAACRDNGFSLKYRRLNNSFKFYYINIGTREECDRSLCASAGIHGDEIGGPKGVLKFLQNPPNIPKDLHLLIFPCVNPYGFENEVRTNALRQDINRRYCDRILTCEAKAAYELFKKYEPTYLITLHEWSGKDGFYMYASDRIKEEKIQKIPEIAEKYFKLHPNTKINDEQVKGGIIWHPEEGYTNTRGKCTLENRAYQDGIHYLTVETPSKGDLEQRAKAQCDILKYVIDEIV